MDASSRNILCFLTEQKIKFFFAKGKKFDFPTANHTPTMSTPIVLPAGTYFIGNPRFLLNDTQLSAINDDGVFEFDGKKVAIASTPADKTWHKVFPHISLIPMSLRPELDDGFHYDYINGDAGKIVTFNSTINISHNNAVFDIECDGSHTTIDMSVNNPYDIKIVCNDVSYHLPF
jgi:hypothetical protein